MTALPRVQPSPATRIVPACLLFVLSILAPPVPCVSDPVRSGNEHTDEKQVRLLLRMRSFYLSFWPEARPILTPPNHDRRREQLRERFHPRLNEIQNLYRDVKREISLSTRPPVHLLKRLYKRVLTGPAPSRSSVRWLQRNPRQRLSRSTASVTTLRSFFLHRLLRGLRRHDRAPSRILFKRVRRTLFRTRNALLKLWALASAGRITRHTERARVRRIALLTRRLTSRTDRINNVLWLWRNRPASLAKTERLLLKTGQSLKKEIARLRRRVRQRIRFENDRYLRVAAPPLNVLRTSAGKRLRSALRQFYARLRRARRRRISNRFDRATGSSREPEHKTAPGTDRMVRPGTAPMRTDLSVLRHITSILLGPRSRVKITRRSGKEQLVQKRIRHLAHLLRRFDQLTSDTAFPPNASAPRFQRFETVRRKYTELKKDVNAWIKNK